MNKAFVREPDATYERCPRCGAIGKPVAADTLAAWVKPDCATRLSEGACFCPFPTCDVVYFDPFDRVIGQSEVVRPVFPKDPEAPICGCFDFSTAEIDADLEEGGVERIRAHVARAKSAEARCRTLSPDGCSCIEAVQRYYFQNRSDNA